MHTASKGGGGRRSRGSSTGRAKPSYGKRMQANTPSTRRAGINKPKGTLAGGKRSLRGAMSSAAKKVSKVTARRGGSARSRTSRAPKSRGAYTR